MWIETAIGVVVYEMYSWRGKCLGGQDFSFAPKKWMGK